MKYIIEIFVVAHALNAKMHTRVIESSVNLEDGLVITGVSVRRIKDENGKIVMED